MVWKDVKQIGAAWAFRKDNRLVVVIKYTPESKEDGNYEENVFLPIAETLGPEWTRNPPEYARCPRENIPTLPPTNAITNATKPHVKGAARKTGSGLELFIASVIFAGLFSWMTINFEWQEKLVWCLMTPPQTPVLHASLTVGLHVIFRREQLPLLPILKQVFWFSHWAPKTGTIFNSKLFIETGA